MAALVRQPHVGAMAAVLTRQHLLPFAIRSFVHLSPGKELIISQHMLAIAYAIERVLKGEDRRLIISLPPRMLKSVIASIALPAFIFAQNPAAQLVTASHTQDLASNFLNKTRSIMESPWYRSLAPQTRLARANQQELITTKGGSRYAIGITGQLLGRGGDIVIIDDPMSGEAANSEAERRAVWEWYRTVAGSRLDNPKEGAIIVLAQRLHMEDLTGRLLEQPGWKHLCLPIEATEDQVIALGPGKVWRRRAGNLLQPERYGPEELKRIRQQQEHHYEAQYLQRPAPPGGNLFKMKDFRHYDRVKLPLRLLEGVFISVDTALTTNNTSDYTAISVWGIRGPYVYLRHIQRGRLGFPEQVAAIHKLATSYAADKIVIEGAASGPMVMGELMRLGHRAFTSTPKDDKVVRAERARLALSRGLVHLPINAPQYDWFVNELAQFPYGKNDDGVDTFSLVMYALDLQHGELQRLSYYRHHGLQRLEIEPGSAGDWVID